ncbi:MAG: DinB family protein [Actinomycetota bacterium]
MKNFDVLLSELSASAENICSQAQRSKWDGESWSPTIILGHLFDVDNEVWMYRFTLLRQAKEKGLEPPQLEWWEPDPEITVHRYGSESLQVSLERFHKSRKEMVEYLIDLSIDDREASAHHATFGKITIESMLQIILDHDAEHLGSLI